MRALLKKLGLFGALFALTIAAAYPQMQTQQLLLQGNGWAWPNAYSDNDFANNRYFNKLPLTITRSQTNSSISTAQDKLGNYIQFPAATLRQTNQGILIEEQRTNGVRNNTFAGAIVQADNVELTTNGNFASCSAGTTCSPWTVSTAGAGSVTFSAGQVQILGDGTTTNNYVAQQVTGLTIGRSYVVTLGSAASTGQILVGTSAGNNSVASFNLVGNGNGNASNDRIAFTATATSVWITLARTPASTGTYTSLSVQDGERVQNGGFTALPVNASQSTLDNGWAWALNGGTGSVVYNAGAKTVSITGDGTHASAFGSISISTIVGQTYTLTFDNTAASANVAAIVTTASMGGGTVLLNVTPNPGLGLQFQFTATTTTSFIVFTKTSVGTPIIGNVSVKSAGSLPTNWNYSNLNLGIIASITGFSTAPNGVALMQQSWVGTATATNTLNMVIDSVATASYGQTWTASIFDQLVSGTALRGTQLELDELTSGSFNSGAIGNPSPTATLTRQTLSKTFTTSTSNQARFQYGYKFTSGDVVNSVTNIGWPQEEVNTNVPSSVASATVNAAGTGFTGTSGTMTYSGAGCTTNPVLNVTASGGITAVSSVATAGTCNANNFPSSTATTWTAGGGLSGGSGASFNLTPVNNAASGVASSPILTATGTGARAADYITVTNSQFVPTNPMWMYAAVTPTFYATGASPVIFGTAQALTFANQVLYVVASTTTNATSINCVGCTGGQQTVPTATLQIGSLNKIAAAWYPGASGQGGNVAMNGFVSTTAGWPVFPNLLNNIVTLGCAPWNPGNFLNGYMSRYAIGFNALPAVRSAAMTNLSINN